MIMYNGFSIVLLGLCIFLTTLVIKYEAHATGENVGTNETLTDLLLLAGILIFVTTLLSWIATI